MPTQRQSILPGYGDVNETSDLDNLENVLAGYGDLNQTVEAAAPGGFEAQYARNVNTVLGAGAL